MSRSTLAIDLPVDHLRITRWHDPLVDPTGHDPRSAYVERYWLALLGPSTTLLVRRLAEELERQPDGFALPLEETARAMGLGLRNGTRGPFFRAIARTEHFGLTRSAGPGALLVRIRMQTLTNQQVDRLPPALRDEHAAWLASSQAVPTDDQRRVRARRLALSLLELGEPVPAAELQLHRWKIHPAVAHDAIVWAVAQRANPGDGTQTDAAGAQSAMDAADSPS